MGFLSQNGKKNKAAAPKNDDAAFGNVNEFS
jgi:hypothetical protein